MTDIDIKNLKPAKLDSNVWYHVSEGRVDDVKKKTKLSSMLRIVKDGTPAVWPAEGINQYWQFQAVSSSSPGRYVLRCSKTSIHKQLSVCFDEAEVTTGHTRPCMAMSNGEDAQKWDVSLWGDGTYRITNVQNGTDYVLDVHKGNPPFMSSNLDTNIQQLAQHWILTSRSKIDESGYSTVFTELPTAVTVTSDGVTKTLISDAPTTTFTDDASSSKGSSGLSSGAAAGIGIGASLAVIALALAAFFLWRRRKRASGTGFKSNPLATVEGGPPTPSSAKVDPYANHTQWPPQYQQTPQELHNESLPPVAPTNHVRHELDSTPVGR